MRVLIIGLGSIAKKHIAAIKQIDASAEVFALRHSENAENVDGVINVYSYDSILNIYFDFAIIANPTSEHANAIKKLIAKKVPLFIEKPLFNKTGKEEQDIITQISANNIPTYLACNLRFLDCLQFIKKEIKGKRINEVNVYCGSYLPEWRPNVDFRTIYSANKEMGGGVHIDLIHELDYVYWIYGAPNKTHSFFTNQSSLQISAYDYANYLWSYDGFSANVILNYYRKDAKRTMEIVIDAGTYIINLRENRVYKNHELIFESSQQAQDTYTAQMNFFINNILHRKESFNDIHEAYKILELCLENQG